ncbi:MAG: aminotransferase class I/II-fold pyridoxal phosphate-dependent enzyme, partial [Woeseiaceae bacterium]
MFETLRAMPPDAILTLIGEHHNDARANKIDLGVGVYRDESGQTPILRAVKKAEQHLVDSQPSKSYVGSGGNPEFNEAIQA